MHVRAVRVEDEFTFGDAIWAKSGSSEKVQRLSFWTATKSAWRTLRGQKD